MVISVDVETTTEEEIMKALTRATFVLIKTKDINDVLELDENVKVLVECCSVIEESFGALYRGMRRSGSIGPLEIRVVQQGTFDALMDYFISRCVGCSTSAKECKGRQLAMQCPKSINLL
ncbi:unnamed protein product [Brassica rapa subsp. trilocularis]